MPEKQKNKKDKIFVAMSGGVDSSVAAALLQKQGFDVYGVFIKGWYPQGITCTWREDRRDAMRVAAVLGISFTTFDFEKEYKKYVIDYMIKEYKEGWTPNPDIMCNKYIKFDLFLKKALQMGADKIATGHYVKKSEIPNPKSEINFKLEISKDLNKDQSYFLWTLTQAQLKYCLFPVGDYLKSEVRELAKKFKLPVAQKEESQGLCFVGEFKLEIFLKNYIKPRSGNIVDEEGKIIGRHRGVQYYTIGQRQGLNLSGGRPYYIVGKNVVQNTLQVATGKREKNFFKKEVVVKNINWVSGKPLMLSKKYQARIRYRQPLQNCKLQITDYGLLVKFDKPQRAVSPGQSLVLYTRNELVGGGIIL